jgi:hypothetical protein
MFLYPEDSLHALSSFGHEEMISGLGGTVEEWGTSEFLIGDFFREDATMSQNRSLGLRANNGI